MTRISMSTRQSPRKYTVRVDNVYFLSRIGLSLRWATRNIAREELPSDVRQLLAHLDELEAREMAAPDATPRSPDDAAP
jgi:hypothetical protein